MTKVGILGDVHGRNTWMRFALDYFAQQDVKDVLQLGDFGIGNEQFTAQAEHHATMHDITVWVTPGNHENYDVIDAIEIDENGYQYLSDNIILLPRGKRWEWEGVSFVSVGGAPSLDRIARTDAHFNRHEPKMWWSQEFVTDEDVAETVSGGHADVLLAHDAPTDVRAIRNAIGHNPHGFHYIDLMYAQEGRVQMDKILYGVKPKLWLHGHYHFLVDEQLGFTRVVGLDRDHHDYSIGTLDLSNLSLELWKTQEPYLAFKEKEIFALETS